MLGQGVDCIFRAMKSSFCFVFVAVASAFLSLSISAGYVYEIEHTAIRGKVEKLVISVEDGNLMMGIPISEEAPKGGDMIFLAQEKVLYLVDNAQRQYMKLDAGTIQRIAAAIEAQMASIPPAQRAMMQQMMGGGAPYTPPAISVEKSGQKKKVEGYNSSYMEVKVDGELRSKTWVAAFDDLKGSCEIADAMKGMAGVFMSFLEAMPMAAEEGSEAVVMMRLFEEIGGFPVQSEDFEDGELESTSRLISVREEDLGSFAPPVGYREQSMGM